MPYDPDKHHRRSIRLPGYDYRQAGGYFVTICVQDDGCLFGKVEAGRMHLNRMGRIVQQQWHRLPRHFPHVLLDAFVVMPNHLHGIIVIGARGNDNRGRRGEAFAPDRSDGFEEGTPQSRGVSSGSAANASPLQQHQPPSPPQQPPPSPTGTEPGSLGAVVQNFKSVSTRRVNRVRKTPGASLWQRNYWEHVIRRRRDLERIRRYIHENPARWGRDRYYVGG